MSQEGDRTFRRQSSSQSLLGSIEPRLARRLRKFSSVFRCPADEQVVLALQYYNDYMLAALRILFYINMIFSRYCFIAIANCAQVLGRVH